MLISITLVFLMFPSKQQTHTKNIYIYIKRYMVELEDFIFFQPNIFFFNRKFLMFYSIFTGTCQNLNLFLSYKEVHEYSH